ncbi:uncharacterized protein LOC119099804 [Pollicipes pollicipes]|uniref:uncharacterized protein LOC119099804 n=1 Tax=Pollicipes pollicipes TaxID=41117 RepID=UPI001885292C|nr:uncharacterized protein LOC119099804 [Pollicipes pollicipes]
MALLPLWFLTRTYWYSQLLGPSLLKPLPDNVVVVGLVVHVLLWMLAAVNLRHYWRLVCYCWRYLSGEVAELGEPFGQQDPAPPGASESTGDDGDSNDPPQEKDKEA